MTMHEELKQFLRTRQNLIFIPNIGNAGDAFIAHATYQLLDRLRLSYTIGSLANIYPGATVVYAGGGALVGPYDYMANFLRRNLGQWKELIILPHTIRSYGELLGEFGANAHLFCREMPSYEFAKARAPHANVYLSDDLAFDCRLEEMEELVSLRTVTGVGNFMANPRRGVRLRRRLKNDASRAEIVNQSGALFAFRADIEKTDVVLPPANVDVSDEFADDSMLPLVALHTTYRVMRFLKHFRIIKTNRLHIAIMSAMLGLQVDLYDNSYGKVRDVFERSMRDKLKNIRCHF